MLGNLQISSINGVGFMPVNLVINPEFTVNQRGAASRTAATGYNYDRWYYDGSNLLQGIENLNLRATTYVVSWSGSATCSYSLNTAASSSQSGQTFTSITNGGTLTISSLGSNNLWIKFSGTLTDLTDVMVVPSAAQTPFIARQYPQELALCQRYYEASDSGTIPQWNGSASAGKTYFGVVYYKVNKRTSASPSIVYVASVGFPAGPAAVGTAGVSAFRMDKVCDLSGHGSYFAMAWTCNAEL